MFHLSSASTFNLDQSQILSAVKDDTFYQTKFCVFHINKNFADGKSNDSIKLYEKSSIPVFCPFSTIFKLVGCIGVKLHCNTVIDAHVFPGFLTPALTQLPFGRHQLLLSLASAEVRGKNMLGGKFASTGYQTKTTR